MKYVGYVGTYTNKGSKGLYRFDLDQGKLAVSLFAELSQPKYVCFAGEYVACVHAVGDMSGMSVYDQSGRLIDRVLYEGVPSCFIAYQDGLFYTSNYHEGSVSVLSFVGGKLEVLKRIVIGKGAGCHQVLVNDGLMYVPCLNLDEIQVFDCDYRYVQSIVFPRGTGCRHGVFHGDYLYVVGELDGCLYVVDVETFEVLRRYDVLRKGAAAIRMVNDLLYCSIRGEDCICVFKVCGEEVRLLQRKKSGGKIPRDFVIVDDLLVVCHQDSSDVVVYLLEDGLLGDVVSGGNVLEGVSVICKALV